MAEQEPLKLGNVTYKTDAEGNTSFSEWEHLQDTLRQPFNRLVHKRFKDVTEIDFRFLTNRAGLKYACWMKDNDTATMTLIRMFLYFFVLGNISDLIEPFFGIPVQEYAATRKYKPQITLFFREDAADVEAGYQPIRSKISFRLMNKTSETITQNDLKELGKEIRSNFGDGQGYVWKRGKDCYVYEDLENGFDFQIYCRNKTDAEHLITTVLKIVDKTPNFDKFGRYTEYKSPTTAFPTVPPNKTILGKTRKVARQRPIAEVRFKFAEIDIYGLPKRICLFDRSFSKPNPIVTPLSPAMI